MTKSKQIKELEGRLSALEVRINALLSASTTAQAQKSEEPTYEEVINEWLCGKETN